MERTDLETALGGQQLGRLCGLEKEESLQFGTASDGLTESLQFGTASDGLTARLLALWPPSLLWELGKGQALVRSYVPSFKTGRAESSLTSMAVATRVCFAWL